LITQVIPFFSPSLNWILLSSVVQLLDLHMQQHLNQQVLPNLSTLTIFLLSPPGKKYGNKVTV